LSLFFCVDKDANNNTENDNWDKTNTPVRHPPLKPLLPLVRKFGFANIPNGISPIIAVFKKSNHRYLL